MQIYFYRMKIIFIEFCYISATIHYEVQWSNIYFTRLIRILNNLHYNLLIHVFNACCTLHENMHRICESLVNKRERMIYVFFPIASTKSATVSKSLSISESSSILKMSSLNFYKLCTKVLADHDQCIQWCKEQNLLASSIKCRRENCSNTLTWTRRASSRDGYEWRCSRRKCNGMASMRQNSWFSESRLSKKY